MTSIVGTKNYTPFKNAALDKIDHAAEQARQVMVTPGAVQQQTHTLKLTEAQDFLKAYPAKPSDADLAKLDTSPWPMLTAEIGITGPTIWDVASTIVAQVKSIKMFLSKIEKLRLAAKKAVRDAATGDAITAAATIAWPSS